MKENIKKTLLNFSKDKKGIDFFILIGGLALLMLLLAKNPFSERNLISNMEPFPDSFHYTVPAINLASGNGFYFRREGRNFKLGVPAIYSLYLTPFYLISKSPQMFYFGNIILSLSSAFLLYEILKRITATFLIKGAVFFFYVTNYFVYWYPNLAMAENLTLFIFLFGLYLLFLNNLISVVLKGITAPLLYGVKFASLPTAGAFLFTYFFQIIRESPKKFKYLAIFGLTAITISSGIYFYELFYLNKDVLAALISFVYPRQVEENYSIANASPANTWFSIRYISKNFPIYANSLIGTPNRFLWDFTPLVPAYLGILGLLGVFISVIKKKFFYLGIMLILSNLFTILFMSTFYTTDNRYIIIALPSLLLGLAIFFEIVFDSFKTRWLRFLTAILLLAIFGIYISQNIVRIKSQISINLRYAETPWYYIAAKNFDDFFNQSDIGEKRKVLITALPPYYIDYFVDSKPILLPLSYGQDFHDDKEKAWGIKQDVVLIDLYKDYLEKDFDVYVSNTALGNESYTNIDFAKIKNSFKLTKVKDGCIDTCNIYRLELKE